jgi:hypothetical protein
LATEQIEGEPNLQKERKKERKKEKGITGR